MILAFSFAYLFIIGFSSGCAFTIVMRERRIRKRREALCEKFRRDTDQLTRDLEYLERGSVEFASADPQLGITDEDVRKALEDLKK